MLHRYTLKHKNSLVTEEEKRAAEKRYSLSLEQLNNLVSDAVATAIRKLDKVEIIDDTAAEPEKGKTAIEVGEMDSKHSSLR